MKENALQGYFNGSKPPFGYKKTELDIPAAKGRKKKLDIDPAEAAIVTKIFDLYLHGAHGTDMGTKQIAAHLNERGVLNRGKKWSRNRIRQLLSDTAYFGQYFFNRKDMKTGQVKPESEWVPVALPPTIEEATFRAVEAKRHARSPDMMAPRLVNSPTLLTGLLKCGKCGAGMMLATGKGGRYRYYKCNTRIAKHNYDCDTPAIPMEKLDELVLHSLAEKVIQPDRLKAMLKAMKAKIKDAQSSQNAQLLGLQKELAELELATGRLYEAVEKGLLPMDSTLLDRAQKLEARRESILIEMAGTRQKAAVPLDKINAEQIQAFSDAMRAKLLDRESGFSKQYLRLLVSEIRVSGNEVRMTAAGTR